MTHRLRQWAVACLSAATLGVGTALPAQGTLSGLGFGYPVGGWSTRVAGTAGAFQEFDAISTSNPAALGGVVRTVLNAQAEPEFRTVSIGAARERTTAQRIPLLTVLLPARRGVAASISASSFLDRSYSIRTTGSAIIDGVPVPTRDRFDMRGAIGDLRAAVGWQIDARFRVGVAGHILTGEHVASRERTFADTLRFGGVLDSARATFFGTALSVGGEARLAKGFTAHASYRAGSAFDARIRDTLRAQGEVPNRLGAALRYDGISGSVFAVGIEQVQWSGMARMGSSQVTASDARNLYAGAEVAGPRLRGYPVLVRVGAARNELPFGTPAGERVRESRLSAGLGLPIARDAASLDLSLQRANRTVVGGAARESAWLLGVGLQIRP
jgi:hypothetical protein